MENEEKKTETEHDTYITDDTDAENAEATTQADADYTKTVISNRPASEMTETEKKAERKLIRDRLKELRKH